MLVRKQFKFESAHRVRSSTCSRCKNTVHGHSYLCEVFLYSSESHDMVMDFGDLKREIGAFMDSLDHSLMLWKDDNPCYLVAQKIYSKRIVMMDKDPTAENIARAILSVVKQTLYNYDVTVSSVRIHETATGYAEAVTSDIGDIITIAHNNED